MDYYLTRTPVSSNLFCSPRNIKVAWFYLNFKSIGFSSPTSVFGEKCSILYKNSRTNDSNFLFKYSFYHVIKCLQIRINTKFQVVNSVTGHDRGNVSQVTTLITLNSSLAPGILQGIRDQPSRLYHAKF